MVLAAGDPDDGQQIALPTPQSFDPNHPKRKRFLRYAERRTQKVLDELARLQRIAKKSAYTYGDAEAESICSAVQNAVLDLTKAFFPEPVANPERKAFRIG